MVNRDSLPNAARAAEKSVARNLPKPETSAEEAIVMSPFTVAMEKDTGYAAPDTLAGTRMPLSNSASVP